MGAVLEDGERTRHGAGPEHRRRQPGTACVDGNADRSLDHDDAAVDFDRRRRLAEPGRAATVPDAEDSAVGRRHRLDSVFPRTRSEEQPSELQPIMRPSYAVLFMTKYTSRNNHNHTQL